ncbi:transglutaminase domain-containing protein [Bacteroides sp. 51]|uniref:transglutaminase domain-containing protein n=1 Tax=Bacteroides sp. 51 TaxID=2302938 RepID=UPI0013D746E7|nr:transglutaminase domain-containing protein [Bacteroides sp. 51]NDV81523.1 transglutaminase domain-containing protein [Bacteroides sp. 51]
MKTKHLLLILSLALLGAACTSNEHFITNKDARKQIEQDFFAKQEALPNGELFDIFDQELTLKEREALTFLYAYSPIGDITDYSGAFHLDNIRSSFQAKQEMPWGDSIPEDIFRHFVLPIRVNNENLDDSRMVFYNELKDRVKHLSVYDAVLEVNHWCHEKVIYTPSDSRTSSPLASVKTAYGRCGEESVFTVAALRAVGIPARQVYTPRWAHTDSNHAWVEAWINGGWYFFGACEPEPILNLAWFNEPASRGMLMHSKVFGRYNGREEIMETTKCYTEINVTANYAPTATTTITVTDANGTPLDNALVEFKIYNYAEFYTVATKTSNHEGKASLTAGKGDMLVWATKNNHFGYQKISFGKDTEVTTALNKKAGDSFSLDLDIIPPVSTPIPAEITPEQKAANDIRLQQEDSIRNAYVATFFTQEQSSALAKELDINTERAINYLTGSRGNWKAIRSFLLTIPPEELPRAIDLLSVISAKDLRDTPTDILLDHLLNSHPIGSDYYTHYILNPRVSNELLTAYRSFFNENFTQEQTTQFVQNPQTLVQWVTQHVRIDDSLNPQRIPIFPIGVWKAGVADTHSRNIFFVALARSLSIPSRIDPVTGKVQYIHNDIWVDVDFEAPAPIVTAYGKTEIIYPENSPVIPKYRQHFSIARIHPDGKIQTLGFDRDNTTISDLEEGNYLLITGVRMAKGNILSTIKTFDITHNQATRIDLALREDNDDIQVIGSIDPEAKFLLAENPDREETSILATTGRGYFIIGILGSRQEPTNHTMRDIAAIHQQFNNWDRSIILLFKDESNWKNFDTQEFGTLPHTITYGIDSDGSITRMIADAIRLPHTNNLPIFVIADTFGRVVFVSQGYTIGIGEQMMKVIGKL